MVIEAGVQAAGNTRAADGRAAHSYEEWWDLAEKGTVPRTAAGGKGQVQIRGCEKWELKQEMEE